MRKSPQHYAIRRVLLTTLLLPLASESFTKVQQSIPRYQTCRFLPSWQLSATERQDADPSSSDKSQIKTSFSTNVQTTESQRTQRPEGVYVRPSAAVERGSGFFIPGLQGPRLRLLAGSLGLSLAAWNHYYGALTITETTTATASSNLAEIMSVAYSLLVLLQGFIESFRSSNRNGSNDLALPTKNQKIKTGADRNALTTRKVWSINTVASERNGYSAEWQNRVEWATQTFMSLTPASCMMILNTSNGISFRIERESHLFSSNIGTKEEPFRTDACCDAVQLLQQSSTGRISLPVTHPVSQALLFGVDDTAAANDDQSKDAIRTVVLQRISDELCICMASDQLLVAFRKQDLTWLGQLATYLNAEKGLVV
ncbi:hypothetical protein MPSEU_000937000 [Mayamaea pseudoterrestris]|nr:hypothetical protein MPSEU_000937000 [Mayamaea pseudoterrestris]